ncbi:MAG: sortase [Clostridia bacterium]|nr:sortase [Clostridia bacterium]
MKNSNYESKFGNILTMILVVVVVIIFGIAGYFAYSIHEQSVKNKAAQTAMADFEQATKSIRKKVKESEDGTENLITEEEIIKPDMSSYENRNVSTVTSEDETNNNQTEPEKVMYEGYEMMGTINIPKTGCNYPILSEVTKHSLEVAVAILYGPGLNVPGNTVIVGHNYRNGLFFSNNSKLSIGDVVTITNSTETVNYIIYKMYYTTPDDASYMKRTVDEGVREISLSTCNNDSSQRLIIWAKEQGK